MAQTGLADLIFGHSLLVQLLGTSQISGTFYTAHGTLNVGGNGAQDVLGSQYISYDMKVNGGGTFNVNWDPNLVGRVRILRLVE